MNKGCIKTAFVLLSLLIFCYPKDIRKYYSNLILLHRNDQKLNEKSNENYFYLSATVELSEDMTIISSTSIDLNTPKGDKIIGQKNTVENGGLSKDHIDWGNIGREIVLNKHFTNVFGFLIKRESDHVGITYIEYKFNDISHSNRTHTIKCVKHKANTVTNNIDAILKPFSD
ncbi:fam-a protein, fragment [Plasmodium vinckei lentum]|uniref:Fam-a protein n=1 Tax=Plasmodium vinckei lentum TaxID=138297 RepID=A0A6V7SLQ1_PLAVN|nr:fam-a protein, fragment [Plasmodium vinckei lentum]